MGERSRPKLWTLGRKIVPNLLPLLVGVPFWVCAAILAKHGSLIDAAELAAFGLLTCTVSLNWLGVTGNEMMRALLARRVRPPENAIFIGLSKPGFVNWLDPHEDIGFLWLEPDQLVIRGEYINLEIPKDRNLTFVFAPNPHTLLGLGRWIALGSGGEVKLLVEPREKGSLRANRTLGIELRSRLDAWAKGS